MEMIGKTTSMKENGFPSQSRMRAVAAPIIFKPLRVSVKRELDDHR